MAAFASCLATDWPPSAVSRACRSLAYSRCAAALATLFPPTVRVCTAHPDIDAPPLFQVEFQSVIRAVPRRVREFRAGRACARCALVQLGAAPTPMPIGDRRAPVWPVGFSGSISHCKELCCAVVAPLHQIAAIGVDVECATPLDDALIDLVCSPTEVADAVEATGMTRSSFGKVAFSAKEAFYKCCSHMERKDLDFRDVQLCLQEGSCDARGAFGVKILAADASLARGSNRFCGRWRVHDGYIFAGVYLQANASSHENIYTSA